jgi:hypothetical protein
LKCGVLQCIVPLIPETFSFPAPVKETTKLTFKHDPSNQDSFLQWKGKMKRVLHCIANQRIAPLFLKTISMCKEKCEWQEESYAFPTYINKTLTGRLKAPQITGTSPLQKSNTQRDLEFLSAKTC